VRFAEPHGVDKVLYQSVNHLVLQRLLDELSIMYLVILSSAKDSRRNSYDGQIFEPVLEQVAHLTDVKPQQTLVDQGFRSANQHPKHVNVLVEHVCKAAEGIRSSSTVVRLSRSSATPSTITA
jgi:hypothetical protein